MALLARRTRDIRPDLTHSGRVFIWRHETAGPLQWRRFPVRPAFLQPEHKLDVVFDHAVRLIGLTEHGPGAADFGRGVRDLVPKDRREALESEAPTLSEDIGVQRDYFMRAEATS